MSDLIREALYPLGYLSAIFFGARFLWQWLVSESVKKSIVTKGFWRLSIVGNTLHFTHAIIQSQFHVAIIQVINAVISWRNLNLMNIDKRVSLYRTLFIMFIAISSVTAVFLYQNGYTYDPDFLWFRIPTTTWKEYLQDPITPLWHVMGIIGLVLFASRFWVQWIQSEMSSQSILGRSFWWLSLVGNFLCLIYFFRINDPVNYIGPICSIILYIRNLMLISRSKKIEAKA